MGSSVPGEASFASTIMAAIFADAVPDSSIMQKKLNVTVRENRSAICVRGLFGGS